MDNYWGQSPQQGKATPVSQGNRFELDDRAKLIGQLSADAFQTPLLEKFKNHHEQYPIFQKNFNIRHIRISKPSWPRPVIVTIAKAPSNKKIHDTPLMTIISSM